jgi:hypothetical protein
MIATMSKFTEISSRHVDLKAAFKAKLTDWQAGEHLPAEFRLRDFNNFP